MGKRKDIILGLMSLIVISILLMTWVYPFSLFSVYKSYTYTADTSVVDSYVKQLNDFEKFYSENSNKDLTTKETPFVMEMFEQDWLVQKGPISMKNEDFDTMLLKVKNARETLLSLTAHGNYTNDQRSYLLDCIKNMLSMEEYITGLKNEMWESRSKINTQFDNLYQGFIGSFFLFRTFYEVSQYK